MGYESKIVIAEKSVWDNGEVYYFYIAEVDLSKVDNEFLQIYNKYGKEIENEISVSGKYSKKDNYGDICKEVNIEVLKDQLNKIIANDKDNYRRYHILKGLLDAFNPYEWTENIVCIHYGY